jgi:hypothetical protein
MGFPCCAVSPSTLIAFFGSLIIVLVFFMLLFFAAGSGLRRLLAGRLDGALVNTSLATTSLLAMGAFGWLIIRVQDVFNFDPGDVAGQFVVGTLALSLSAGIGASAASATHQRWWRWALIAQLVLPLVTGLATAIWLAGKPTPTGLWNPANDGVLFYGAVFAPLIGLTYATFLRQPK